MEEKTGADAPGAAAPSPSPTELKAGISASGVPPLTSTGTTERNARTMLGRWRKDLGDGVAIDALSAAQSEAASDPIPFIRRTRETRSGKRPDRQGSGRR